MANILKIYKTQLTPARNALIDEIEDYLSAIENPPDYYTGDDALIYTDEDFQFIRPDLDIRIKINRPNTNNDLFDSIGNYVRIEQTQNDGDSAIWYYFIVGARWIAQATVELSLSMDTINTFHDLLIDKDNWSEKTQIIRQHEDQISIVDIPNTTRSFYMLDNVDKAGEDINVPFYVKTNDETVEEPNSTGTAEWYLVYMTDNSAISEVTADGDYPSDNTLKCYIYPKTPLVYQQSANTDPVEFTRTVSQFSNGYIYGITSGGVSFSDVTVTGKYGGYSAMSNTSMGLIDSSNTGTYANSMTISGYVNVGSSFTRSGATYTCYAVVWYLEDDVTGATGRMNLPVGLFSSSADSKTHYAVYLSEIDGSTSKAGWYFRQRHASYSFGWQIRQNFTYYRSNTSSSNTGAYRMLSDTSNTSDNWFTGSWDSNWSRNVVYCTSGTFTFTSDTQYIYQLDYQRATPSVNTLVNSTKWYSNGTSGTSYQLSCIDYLNRSSSTLVKILALPYCPSEITISSGSIASGTFTLSFDNNLVDIENETTEGYTNYRRLYYKAPGKTFGKDLNPVTLNFKYTDDLYNFYGASAGYLTERNMENEPKMKSSNFLLDHFVYDNVSKNIRREDLEASENSVYVTPYYQPTNTIGSDILYNLQISNGNYLDNIDWDTIMISSRNNELPIYNNDYLNYIRYSYKTERENLEASTAAQRQSAIVNTVLGVGGSTAAGAYGGAKGGVGGIIAGAAIGLATGIAKSASSINTMETNIANAQRSLDSKVDQLKNSALSISSGATAVDLMTEYTDNRLHYMTYEPPELLKEAIYDKFYYCGYSHPVQQKPNLYTRFLFNFVQCDPIFNNEGMNRYNYYLEDIKERFRAGVTIYHDVEYNLQNFDTTELMYDWKQQYENWYFNIEDVEINLTATLNEDYASDNRYQTTITHTVSNRFFIPRTDAWRYYIKAQYEEDGDWEVLYSGRYTTNNIVFTNSATWRIPIKLKFTLRNSNIDWFDSKTYELDVPKPDLCTLTAPTISMELGTDVMNLSSDYIIGANSGIYYQLRMEYDGDWVEYPYYDDTDYSNDYTDQEYYQMGTDMTNRSYDIDNLSIVYVRVYNVNTGEYSDWAWDTYVG